ncbi:Succinate dehydrogenase cytochrome b-556 subunit [hydrothermal vent metagenome]|uniref:Succinate dehydrogenase cytochrome b-556 subunit n=1 Tax=hydrothermal vent metagenome TaxID=652676 RepID=A0A3B0V6M0_9ZZZZ
MKLSTRPLSPHMQVYKMPLSAKLSILHRLTGLALSVGAVVLVYWLFSLAYLSGAAVVIHIFFSSIVGKIMLIGWTFSFFYHFCNGIRHLFWDIGKGYEIATVNKSGIIVIIIATVLTAGLWVLGV